MILQVSPNKLGGVLSGTNPDTIPSFLSDERILRAMIIHSPNWELTLVFQNPPNTLWGSVWKDPLKAEP